MSWAISSAVEDALWTAVARRVAPESVRQRALIEAIAHRSRRYTSERERMLEPVTRPEGDLAARALFFAVADAAKIMLPLAELDRDGLLPRGNEIALIDAGAGTGAMTLGAIDYLHRTGALQGRKLAVRAVDRDMSALAIATAAAGDLAGRWQVDVAMETACGDAIGDLAPQGQTGDLVIAGSLVNELPEAKKQAFVRAALAACRPDGAVIAIEPALRETARDLHRLRDWIISEGLAHVFAPCIRQAAPCPALADERDWCHEDRPTALPARAARLARATGLRAHGLKFAYLVVRKSPEGQLQGAADAATPLRVVSALRKSKGKSECYGCGEAGRVPLRLLRRHRSGKNRPFERLARGDLVGVPAPLAAGGDIGPEDGITADRIGSAGEISDR